MIGAVETSDAIAGYRAVRQFDGRPLAAGHLDAILRAGRRAPSSKNTQPWGFVAVTERARLQELSRVGDYAGHLAGAAAGVAFVVPNAEDPQALAWLAFDSGQAAQNMLLTAWSIGVGGVHAAVYDEPMARQLLGYPEGLRCDLILSFGYPADAAALATPPRAGGRRSLDDVVHRERW
jgi:nitroreductase